MLDKIKEIYYHQIFRIIILLIVLWIAATIGIQYLEHGELNDIENAFWWTIVTITTVGYGDYSPESLSGRILAIFLMLAGIGLVSTITGSISSIFTTRKIHGCNCYGQKDISELHHTLTSPGTVHQSPAMREGRACRSVMFPSASLATYTLEPCATTRSSLGKFIDDQIRILDPKRWTVR